MTASLFTPDLRRILDDLARRLGILERRTKPAGASAPADGHDGTGPLSVLVTNSEDTAVASGDSSIVIGGEFLGTIATASGDYGIAIGGGALASGDTGIAIGLLATATEGNSVALGDSADSTAAAGLALGAGSDCAYANSVALGDHSQTTAPDQVNMGFRNLVAGAPTSAPADATLLNRQFTVWVDESTNLLTFKVKYSTGTVKIGTVALV